MLDVWLCKIPLLKKPSNGKIGKVNWLNHGPLTIRTSNQLGQFRWHVYKAWLISILLSSGCLRGWDGPQALFHTVWRPLCVPAVREKACVYLTRRLRLPRVSTLISHVAHFIGLWANNSTESYYTISRLDTRQLSKAAKRQRLWWGLTTAKASEARNE